MGLLLLGVFVAILSLSWLLLQQTALPGSRTPKSKRVALLKLDWDGDVLWKRKLNAHHDVGMTPDGKILALTKRAKLFRQIDSEIGLASPVSSAAGLKREREKVEQI